MKRYSLESDEIGRYLVSCSWGNYVQFEDAEKLQTRCEKLEKALKLAIRVLNKIKSMPIPYIVEHYLDGELQKIKETMPDKVEEE